MIEVQNLTKVYLSKHKNDVVALDDINITFPNKGFVFILGQSGSGKSTLLNSIGGIDDITNGDVIIEGVSTKDMKIAKRNKYLLSYFGFIFQDYHLIDQLTIQENLAIVSNDKNKNQLIYEHLCNVGLAGYEKRLPKQLSGGEKQRVAIARVLLKNPKVILADEPTGNLDKESTQIVLDLLKEISKEKLVIMVSHSLRDAEKYGDRIIELSEGKIVRDEVKEENYQNNFKLDHKTLYLPHNYDLNKSEIKLILNNRTAIKKIVQINHGFKKAIIESHENQIVDLNNKKMTFKDNVKLFTMFNNKRIFSKFIRVLLGALLMTITYLMFGLNAFDAYPQIINNAYGDNPETIRLQKIYYNENNNSNSNENVLLESDYQNINQVNSTKKYYLYSDFLFGASTSSINHSNLLLNYQNFYTQRTIGTLNCDEEFLIKKFGINGKLDVLAGDIHSNIKGHIITDYLADSIMYTNKKIKNYEELIGPNQLSDGYVTGNIKAIINTGYKQKYEELASLSKDIYINLSSNAPIINHPDFYNFVLEAYEYLGVTYNIDKDYKEYANTTEYSEIQRINSYTYVDNGKYIVKITQLIYDKKNMHKLADNEISMDYRIYNLIFDTDYTETNYKEYVFDNQEITIGKSESNTNNNIINQKTVKIKSLNNIVNTIYGNESTYESLYQLSYHPYAVYLDGEVDVDAVLELLESKEFLIFTNEPQANISYIERAIEIFQKFIWLISVITILAFLGYTISIGIKNIKNNYYEIGILKAIGIKQSKISISFILQNLFIGIFLVLFTVCGIYIGAKIANSILVESFENVLSIKIRQIEFISLIGPLINLCLIIEASIIFVTSFIPLIYLNKVKIINVLKAKE